MGCLNTGTSFLGFYNESSGTIEANFADGFSKIFVSSLLNCVLFLFLVCTQSSYFSLAAAMTGNLVYSLTTW